MHTCTPHRRWNSAPTVACHSTRCPSSSATRPTPDARTPDLVTAGRALGLGRSKSYELAKAGQFPCPVLRYGSRHLVTRADILATLRIDDSAAEESVPISPLIGDRATLPARMDLDEITRRLVEILDQPHFLTHAGQVIVHPQTGELLSDPEPALRAIENRSAWKNSAPSSDHRPVTIL